MRKIKIIIVILLFSACNSYRSLDKYYGFTYKIQAEDWIEGFKNQVFFSCIEEGYKNDSILLITTSEKFSNPHNDMRYKDILKAKEIGKEAYEKGPKRLYFIGLDSTPLKRHIATACLKYYVSRELDSIAKNEFEIYFKEFINRKEWDGRDINMKVKIVY